MGGRGRGRCVSAENRGVCVARRGRLRPPDAALRPPHSSNNRATQRGGAHPRTARAMPPLTAATTTSRGLALAASVGRRQTGACSSSLLSPARRPMRPASSRPATPSPPLAWARRTLRSTALRSAALPAGGADPSTSQRPARLVFLGTPAPAASVLASLLDAAAASTSSAAPFEVAAVVTQPAKRQGRGRKAAPPSPVAALALSRGFAAGGEEDGTEDGTETPSSLPLLLTPSSASDPAFLATLASLAPDLCITAAYGLILPRAFLDTPRVGTLNLHPSLLPRWRGAAPVPRALEAGDATTGISVAWTVSALDAGPLLAVEERAVPPDAAAPALLEELMAAGARLLLSHLPLALSFPDRAAAHAAATPQEQTGRLPTHAARLSKAEAGLDFGRGGGGLRNVWNRARAFAGWPVAWAAVRVGDEADAPCVRLKVLEAHPVEGGAEAVEAGPGGALRVATPRGGPLRFPCADGSGFLAVTRVQAPGGKPLVAGDYINGLAGRGLWVAAPGEAGAE